MSDAFQALMVEKTDAGQACAIKSISDQDLMAGDVSVKIDYSTVNYKDGLAVTGNAPIIRAWPMIPGIDFAGTVTASERDEFSLGDRVVLNGWGVGESHFGGYAQQARVNGDWLVKLPDQLSSHQAMAIGTAGYTAMLCVMALEAHGVTKAQGPIVVTGAAGGVGSVAVALLNKLGFEVIASTGRVTEAAYLKALGANEIIDRAELNEPGKPVGKERWAGAVDTVGSHTLANVLAHTSYGGTVTACGLAQGMDLPATVIPFILRSVSLLGIDSVMAPKQRRIAAWARLASDLEPAKLAAMTEEAPLAAVPKLASEIIAGKIRGRLVINVNE